MARVATTLDTLVCGTNVRRILTAEQEPLLRGRRPEHGSVGGREEDRDTGSGEVAYGGQVGVAHGGGLTEHRDRLEPPGAAGDRHRDGDLDRGEFQRRQVDGGCRV